MREVMFDVVHFGFDSGPELGPKVVPVGRLKRFLNRRRAADVFDFLRH